MRLLRITDSKINDNGQLEIKLVAAKATYTAEEYAPHGTDARPPKDLTVAYSDTTADGDDVVVGVLVLNRKAEIGEHRLFSTDAENAFKCNVWLRADGTILIGTSDTPGDYTNFAVLYNELKEELDKLKTDHNDLVTKYNSHTHAVSVATTCPAGAGTGTGSAVATTSTDTPNNSDFSACKHENLKYNE